MAPAIVAPLESNTVPSSSSTMLVETSIGSQSEQLVSLDTPSISVDNHPTNKKRKTPLMSSVFSENESLSVQPVKRGRGRPPKSLAAVQVNEESSSVCLTPPPSSIAPPPAKRGRGRPPRNVQEFIDAVEIEESPEKNVESDSVFLTPPPPRTPSPPRRRRGRPRKIGQ